MRVGELIQWLQKQNPEDFVGLLDYGQDTGDWTDLQLEDKGINNLLILSYDEAIAKMKEDHAEDELRYFRKRYDEEADD